MHDALPALLTGMPDPELVRAAERMLADLPQVDLQTQHLVHGGMYARTIFIPAGTFLTGALTKQDNVCVVYGDIEVTTDEGPKRLTGFHVLPAKAGAKRAGRTFADTWWTTLMTTEHVEVADIERQMTDEADLLQTNRAGIEFAHPNHLEVEA